MKGMELLHHIWIVLKFQFSLIFWGVVDMINWIVENVRERRKKK